MDGIDQAIANTLDNYAFLMEFNGLMAGFQFVGARLSLCND